MYVFTNKKITTMESYVSILSVKMLFTSSRVYKDEFQKPWFTTANGKYMRISVSLYLTFYMAKSVKYTRKVFAAASFDCSAAK